MPKKCFSISNQPSTIINPISGRLLGEGNEEDKIGFKTKANMAESS